MKRSEIRIPGLGSVLSMVLAATVAVAVVGGLMLSGMAAQKSHRVSLGWEEALGPPEEALTRYSRTAANDSALELERLTPALGIDLAPKSFEGRPRSTLQSQLGFRSVKRHLGPWLDTQLGRPHRALEEPPAALTTFLDRHAEALDAVRDRLLTGEVPRWELDLEKMLAAPVPNLLGHIDLQNLLLGDALVRSGAGDPDGAALDLEASWRLNRALRDAPMLITQLVAVAVARLQAGALRQLDAVPAVWRHRLHEHDYRSSFLTALGYAGWFWSKAADPSVLGGELSLSQRVTAVLARPYVEYSLADLSERFRDRLDNLARLKAWCHADLDRFGADLDVPVPRWNLAHGLVPNLTSVVHRIARLEVDLELTAKLLELDAAREERGAWPEALPDGRASAACPGDRWIYEIDAEGAASVSFSRKAEWPDQLGLMLPTRFSLEIPSVRKGCTLGATIGSGS